MYIRNLIRYIFNSDYRAVVNDTYGIHTLDDEEFLKRKFRLIMGYDLDLDNPKLLNEKLQFLKLYGRKPEYTTMVDKYAAKKWVAERIGEEYIIPTLGIWNKYDDIDFEKLPDQFVLKCTHDSGGPAICYDKRTFDYDLNKRKLEERMRRNYYYVGREWPYKDVTPRIIAEPLLKNMDSSELVDYKIYTYGGKPIYFMYSLGEAEHNVRNHKFDVNLNSIDHLFKKQPAINVEEIVLPDNINKMIELASILCKGTQHLRVDLYNIDGHIYFGELTFYSNGGFINIESKEYSQYLANLIDLFKV